MLHYLNLQPSVMEGNCNLLASIIFASVKIPVVQLKIFTLISPFIVSKYTKNYTKCIIKKGLTIAVSPF